MKNKPSKGYSPDPRLWFSNQPHIKREVRGTVDLSKGKVLNYMVLSASAVVDGVETPLDPDDPNNAEWFESKDTKSDNKE